VDELRPREQAEQVLDTQDVYRRLVHPALCSLALCEGREQAVDHRGNCSIHLGRTDAEALKALVVPLQHVVKEALKTRILQKETLAGHCRDVGVAVQHRAQQRGS
jgi:hypothetical protein